MRNATYRPVADVSLQVAGRDLRAAAKQGYLVAHGERRGRYYTAAARLLEIHERTREPRTDVDPFEDPDPDALYLPGMER